MIVDLLRHGDTGRSGFMDGRTDHPLSDAGWAQVRAQTEHGQWELIVSSPLRRAREAAEVVARTAGLNLRVDAAWAEMDFGAWDGQPRSGIEEHAEGKAALARFYADPVANPPPHGEARDVFETRIRHALRQLAGDAAAGPILVVTHAGPMRAALAIACGLELKSLWALRIGYGTRIRLHLEYAPGGKLWGEIVEIIQP